MLIGKTKDFINIQGVYFIYSIGTVASKKASQYPFLSREFLMFYMLELIIIFIYAYLWQVIIKRVDLITAYSSKGAVMFWTLIWSSVLFKEHIKLTNILGLIIITTGILLVIRDDK
ncbi:MAG: hypothetical protein K0R09_1546 [Clostridiales bacterium]|jgi:drug/metabolite transporter (DMT)-like permease|nr:hypothetical protein [Clostridiales bacterium]